MADALHEEKRQEPRAPNLIKAHALQCYSFTLPFAFLMPITKAIRRCTCVSPNAFNPTIALSAVLGLDRSSRGALVRHRSSRLYTSNGLHLKSSSRTSTRPFGLDVQDGTGEELAKAGSKKRFPAPLSPRRKESLDDLEVTGGASVAEWHRNTGKRGNTLAKHRAKINEVEQSNALDRAELSELQDKIGTQVEQHGGVNISYRTTRNRHIKAPSQKNIVRSTPSLENDEYSKGPQFILRAARQMSRNGEKYRATNTRKWQGQMRLVAEEAYKVSRTHASDSNEIQTPSENLNYTPWVIDLPRSPFPLEEMKPLPWAILPAFRRLLDPFSLLEQEIEKFHAYISPSAAERAARQAIVDEVMNTIRANTSTDKIQAELQGSEQTGLVLPQSDIDIRLSWIGSNESKPATMTKTIRHIGLAFNKSLSFIDVRFRQAAYPIVTAIHKATGIEVQVVSAPSTQRQQEITAHYLNELPHLRAVYSVVKTAFQMRGLIDVHTGGIGAYGLFMMLVAAVKSPRERPLITPAEYFLEFLGFFSDFDNTKHGISVDPPGTFPKHDASIADTKAQIAAAYSRENPIEAGQLAISHRRPFQPYLLCLQDPATPMNDLGRKTNAYKHIRKTLRAMHRTILKDLENITIAAQRDEEWMQESLLEPQVGRCHEVLLRERRRVEMFGLKVLLERERAKDGESAGGTARDEVSATAIASG